MVWKTETKRPRAGVKEIYVFNDEDKENTYALIFKIRAGAKNVEYFPRSRWFPIDKITFEGFTRPPDEINEKGFFKTSAALSALQRKLNEASVSELVIAHGKDTGMRKVRNGRRLTLSYADFQRMVVRLRTMNTALQADLRQVADVVFHELVPRQFALSSGSPRSRLTRLLASLDDSIIPEMSGDEINNLVEFTSSVIGRRYVKASYRHKLMSGAKLKIDEVAISQVIDEFEAMLGRHHTEAAWGQFLRRNLYLVESRYVHIFDRLNVITGRSREADFGLIDTHGFLDIFEIKTPGTKLLSASQDRGNYYWNTEAIKAITQAEKYLYNAEQRGPTLEKDIKRELKTEARVTRPRAVLIMGDANQLDAEEKVEDFRVLRMSLKNIEIVLYDELLDRLKNQRNKMGAG